MGNPGRRATVFGSVAAAYAAHRPGYPGEAVAWALGGVAGDVVDLAAGTGKLTEALTRCPGTAVTAVEPDPAMLDELRARFPDVRALEGAAEAVPLPDSGADAVLVGTAWHWFDPPRALAEIARVLRPGGVFALLSNGDDPDVEWVTGYRAAAADGRAVASQSGDVELPQHPAFTPAERRLFRWEVPTTVDDLLATLATHSWALMSTPADRDSAFARIRAYLATRPETASGSFTLPLVCSVLRASRR
ncbi:MAG: class I SAM-dependent methyltransferase [Kineosporiaceae bacterium]